ncbi:hypothetical protein QNI19_11745 [Cytophagaceae bacterium DM2B3-1]|uniref:DUF4292 domain-containing protein n=1 Tax=Xanthocytophaga flava TaxID=3048013 RepID=A0ABT7CIP4_9BACT|nr:hypothetical protein [Xanthocytophaga flavus]MDJ1469660.1 hypothetical protein [Xanthocytophaga flavus]MDJ1493607.1 hypothetical protein [Xanthocytophaga flavus]
MKYIIWIISIGMLAVSCSSKQKENKSITFDTVQGYKSVDTNLYAKIDKHKLTKEILIDSSISVEVYKNDNIDIEDIVLIKSVSKLEHKFHLRNVKGIKTLDSGQLHLVYFSINPIYTKEDWMILVFEKGAKLYKVITARKEDYLTGSSYELSSFLNVNKNKLEVLFKGKDVGGKIFNYKEILPIQSILSVNTLNRGLTTSYHLDKNTLLEMRNIDLITKKELVYEDGMIKEF